MNSPDTDNKNLLKGMRPAALLSLAASFLLFIYGPFELYINNYIDFNFDIYDLLRYMPLIMFAVFAVSTVLLFILKKISEKAFCWVLAVYFVALLATYIQGTFFVRELPVLDGASIDWSDYSTLRVSGIIIWGVLAALTVLFLAFAGHERFQKTVSSICIVLIAYLAVTAAINCVSNPKALKAKNTTCMTADSALEMSRDKDNFVIFLMDCVDAGTFNDVMEDNPEYREVFADFTCYPDAMGCYSCTTKAVPFILFGKWYDNTVYYPYYIQDAIEESPFIQRLNDDNYNMSIYFEYIERANLDATMFENFRNVRNFKEPVKFCKMIIMLTGLRYLPFDLKPMCVVSPDNIYFDTLKTVEGEDIDYYEFEDAALYKRLYNSNVSYSDKSCFRFLYCNGAHTPYSYNKDVEIIENGSYYQNVEATIKIADTYLKLLKESDTYDNSVIIFLADHGVKQYDGKETKKQNPYLLIKGKNEKHDFKVNMAPVSHADLGDAYMKLLDGASGDECFSWKQGDRRERRYMFSEVGIQDPIYEYVQTGYASDTDSLVPTGNVYEFDWACVDAREAEERAKK